MIAWLEFEFTYYEVTVQHVGHYSTGDLASRIISLVHVPTSVFTASSILVLALFPSQEFFRCIWPFESVEFQCKVQVTRLFSPVNGIAFSYIYFRRSSFSHSSKSYCFKYKPLFLSLSLSLSLFLSLPHPFLGFVYTHIHSLLLYTHTHAHAYTHTYMPVSFKYSVGKLLSLTHQYVMRTAPSLLWIGLCKREFVVMHTK